MSSDENIVLNYLDQDSFFMIPRIFIDFFKEDKDSIFMLSHLVSQYKYLKSLNQLDDYGYFFSTIDAVEDKYYLNGYSQRRSLIKLEQMGIVSIQRKSIPRRRFFKLNFEVIAEIIKNRPVDVRKETKMEFYSKLNSAIENGWEEFKVSVDNMNKTTALAMFFWKRVFDFSNSKNKIWVWDSQLFGILNSWIISKKKTGNVDFNYFLNYLEKKQYEKSSLPFSFENLMKHFVVWSKSQPELAPDNRLYEPELILEKARRINEQ